MSANLSSLSPITTTATSLSNLVLVSPQSVVGYQPQNSLITTSSQAKSFTNPALLFHYEGEQSVVIESDITDHYIEDNTAIQDQISIKPTVINVHGFIGELNDVAPIGNTLIQSLLSKLTIIGSYTPALSIIALNAYNQAFQAFQIAANAVNSAVSAWGSINNLLGSGGYGENVIGNNGLQVSQVNSTINRLTQNRQQLAFQQFYAYQQSRTLFTVQTPWAVFQNMAILHLRAVQDSETNVISDFEISFKQIRLATSIVLSNAETLILQGRLLNQNDANNPIQQGNTATSSLPAVTVPVNYSGIPAPISTSGGVG